MEMTAEIGDLSAALAIAQETIAGAAKDRSNPAFKSKYATLASVWEAWQGAGPKQGLAMIQLPGAVEDGKVSVTTMISHKSGQWIRETLTIPVTKQDAQGYGSALTYARRYALAAFVGVAPEDDDGNAAVGQRSGPLRAVEATGPISAAQRGELQNLADEVGADMPRFCKYFQVGSLAEIPAARLGDAMAALNAKRKVRA